MSDPIYLAVHAGHNASAAIMRNGVIVTAALEERFCRKKNYVGYPQLAIDYCLRQEGLKGSQFTRIAFTTTAYQGLLIKAKTSTQFSIRDYIDYFGERYYARKFRGENTDDYLHWLDSDEKFNRDTQYYDFGYLTDEVMRDGKRDIELFSKEQRRKLSTHLGVAPEKIEFLDHHTCHAYYAYFGSPFRGKDCITLTMDGWGDGRNQSVWKVSDDRFTFLTDSAQNDIGRLYKMATLILGMRPDEHEFKVMGMAPYAKLSYIKRTKQVIENLLQVEGMRIVHKQRPKDLYTFLREVWLDHRFDNIAGAVQLYTEELATQLVRNIVKETGVRRIVLSGGVAMNVKMNKAIGELPEVDDMYVCGSGGDESLSVGGCYLLNQEARNNQGATR
jgi:carbamoyltransferase